MSTRCLSSQRVSGGHHLAHPDLEVSRNAKAKTTCRVAINRAAHVEPGGSIPLGRVLLLTMRSVALAEIHSANGGIADPSVRGSAIRSSISNVRESA